MGVSTTFYVLMDHHDTTDVLLTVQDQNEGFHNILSTDGPPRQLTFVPQFNGLVHPLLLYLLWSGAKLAC